MTLLDETRALLDRVPRRLSYSNLASRAGVSRQWVSRLAKQELHNPALKKVQAFHDFLKGIVDSAV
jgi:transcriptional regulator with XRE-family HTH domain